MLSVFRTWLATKIMPRPIGRRAKKFEARLRWYWGVRDWDGFLWVMQPEIPAPYKQMLSGSAMTADSEGYVVCVRHDPRITYESTLHLAAFLTELLGLKTICFVAPAYESAVINADYCKT